MGWDNITTDQKNDFLGVFSFPDALNRRVLTLVDLKINKPPEDAATYQAELAAKESTLIDPDNLFDPLSSQIVARMAKK